MKIFTSLNLVYFLVFEKKISELMGQMGKLEYDLKMCDPVFFVMGLASDSWPVALIFQLFMHPLIKHL